MSQIGDIEVRVVEADGLDYETDALVLKHAQALHGLDAQVAERIGVDPETLPPPDGFRIFHDPRDMPARAVLFVGVRSIGEFSYSDIRRFAYKGLCSVASALPNASDVTLTLHGVGFGLDEVECFEAEVGGILDAITSRDVPHSLRFVNVLEINPGRAERMRDHLARLLRAEATDASEPDGSRRLPEAESVRDAGRVGAERPHAFVAMPFDESFSDLFHYGMSSAVRDNGLLCERIDQQPFTGDVVERLKEKIRTAQLVVADLTGSNANVFLEVGFAWGSGVPTVLVCHQESTLKFDVQGQKCIFYSSIQDLETKLGAELAGLVKAH